MGDIFPLTRISPALDIIQTRPSDPAHLEYGGISRQAHSLLVTEILNPSGQTAYLNELRKFPFPPGGIDYNRP